MNYGQKYFKTSFKSESKIKNKQKSKIFKDDNSGIYKINYSECIVHIQYISDKQKETVLLDLKDTQSVEKDNWKHAIDTEAIHFNLLKEYNKFKIIYIVMLMKQNI